MLKLKLWYFGHLMQRTDSLEKTQCWARLKAGGEGDDKGWDGWMTSPTQWTWVWISSGSWWLTEKPGVLQSIGSQRVGHNWATELNWLLRFVLFNIFYIQIILKTMIDFYGNWMKSMKLLREKGQLLIHFISPCLHMIMIKLSFVIFTFCS